MPLTLVTGLTETLISGVTKAGGITEISSSVTPDLSAHRLVGNTFFPATTVSSASYNRRSRKRIYIAETCTGNIYLAFTNSYISNVATVTNGTHTITVSATFQYGGVIYPVTFSGASSVALAAGSTVMGKVVGLSAMTAGQFGYANTRTIGTSGAQTRIRGNAINARFDEGAQAAADTTDEISSYGIGATATATITGGAITAITFNNASANGLYTGGDQLIAYQTSADGTVLQRIIGTYTVSGGNPAVATITDSNTDWVAPAVTVNSRLASFTALTGDVYGPYAILAVPTSGSAKQVLILGDSNGHSSADVAQSVNGFKGIYERGINGTASTANISFSGRKASDVDDISTGGLSTVYNLYLPYHNRVLYALGGNDAATDSAATITANINACATIYRNAGKEVAIATIPNRTTGTFYPAGGQTPTAGFATGAAVDTLNTDIRVNTIVSNWGDPIDSRILSQDSVTTDVWRTDLGQAITDGTHYNQFGLVNLQANASWPAMFV